MSKQRKFILNEDIWQFIQQHKNKTREQFGCWLIGQQYTDLHDDRNPKNKIIKAIEEYNESLNFSKSLKSL